MFGCYQGDVWIIMEVMDMSLDKFYETVYKQGRTIPEAVLGKIAFAVSFFLVIKQTALLTSVRLSLEQHCMQLCKHCL